MHIFDVDIQISTIYIYIYEKEALFPKKKREEEQ